MTPIPFPHPAIPTTRKQTTMTNVLLVLLLLHIETPLSQRNRCTQLILTIVSHREILQKWESTSSNCLFASVACRFLPFSLSAFESLAQQVVIWARSSQGFESGDDDVISDEFRRQEAQEEQAIGQGVEHSHELLRWHG
jgi:hypothetical protein